MHQIRKLSKEEFPPSLLEIPEPPEKLYIKGTLPNWNSVFLCVVGSRRYTGYAKEACEKIISGLRGYNITIVSGLALGIDAIAHMAALDAGLKIIAVPGSGLNEDVLYPRTNKYLAEKILSSGGTLLSEYEPEFRATTWSFPKRNRIMSGISDTVLVIEANEKSGTLITARLGLDYNKEVCVIPASIFSDGGKGSNKLLKQGATPITSSEDLLEVLGFEKEKDSGQQKLILEDCSPEEKLILESLNEAKSRDELIRESSLPTSEANSIISIMEIKGLIKESLGKIYKDL